VTVIAARHTCARKGNYDERLYQDLGGTLAKSGADARALCSSLPVFTQLWWKVPPGFGCPPDYAVTTGTIDTSGRVQLKRTRGLCDWMGIESVWSKGSHPVFVADLVQSKAHPGIPYR